MLTSTWSLCINGFLIHTHQILPNYSYITFIFILCAVISFIFEHSASGSQFKDKIRG